RKDNSLKILCEYKTELIILFDDFFRSQQLPKISPALHFLFQQTNLIDAHFYRCKVQEHTIQLSFLKDKNITLLRLDVFDDVTSEYITEDIKISEDCHVKFLKFLKTNFDQEIYDQLYTPEIFYEACKKVQSFYDHQDTLLNRKYREIDKKKGYLSKELKKLIKMNTYPELYNGQYQKIPYLSIDVNQDITWQNFKTSNTAYLQLCEKLSSFKITTNQLIQKTACCTTEKTTTNKFNVVFSYDGYYIKEFILLLPYNKSMEIYELNKQKI
ncbi:pentapeptide repeat-containing protein, partial [Escherichia coli]|nr:pentapeptide repeat-containing protein [Escherichia coli]